MGLHKRRKRNFDPNMGKTGVIINTLNGISNAELKYYSVSFDANGGDPYLLTNNEATTLPEKYLYRYGDLASLLPYITIKKEGYTFTGYKDQYGTTYPKDTLGKSIKVDKKYILTATFEPNTYNVTLNGNGGSGTKLTSYTYGTAKTLPTWTKQCSIFQAERK